MKLKLIGVALCGLLSVTVAQARLGWSLKECLDKYGTDQVVHNRAYGEVHVFHVNEIEVHIVFDNDAAVFVTYRSLSGSGFDQTELDSLLDKNESIGAEWGSPDNRTERNTKYTLWFAEKRGEWVTRAEYDQNGNNAGVLMIQTKAEYEHYRQEERNNGV
jgi:hypothetical protein